MNTGHKMASAVTLLTALRMFTNGESQDSQGALTFFRQPTGCYKVLQTQIRRLKYDIC